MNASIHRQIVIGSLAIALSILMSNSLIVAEDKPTFNITTKRENDKVEVSAKDDSAMFSIRSPFGISQAVIERTEDTWPNVVTLRTHLNGLESFRVTNGKVTLHAAVSSHDEKQRVRLWKDNKEDTPLDSNSPYWTEIRMIGGDGKPSKTIPLKDGYFEMTLPKRLFDGNPKSITVNWIDFYR